MNVKDVLSGDRFNQIQEFQTDLRHCLFLSAVDLTLFPPGSLPSFLRDCALCLEEDVLDKLDWLVERSAAFLRIEVSEDAKLAFGLGLAQRDLLSRTAVAA